MNKKSIGRLTDATGQSQAIGNVRGSQSGGSKPTPQAAIMKQGNGRLHGSNPKDPHKLRG